MPKNTDKALQKLADILTKGDVGELIRESLILFEALIYNYPVPFNEEIKDHLNGLIDTPEKQQAVIDFFKKEEKKEK